MSKRKRLSINQFMYDGDDSDSQDGEVAMKIVEAKENWAKKSLLHLNRGEYRYLHHQEVLKINSVLEKFQPPEREALIVLLLVSHPRGREAVLVLLHQADLRMQFKRINVVKVDLKMIQTLVKIFLAALHNMVVTGIFLWYWVRFWIHLVWLWKGLTSWRSLVVLNQGIWSTKPC